jgi:hypothetical protein
METDNRWYVYELVDPRTKKPFYIGKGKRDRIDHHEKDARKGVCSEKCNLIRELQELNLVVIKQKVAHFFNEQDAYDFEEKRIAKIGLHNLTNVLAGGGKARPRIDMFSPSNCLKAIDLAKDWFALWLKNKDSTATVALRDGSNLAKFQKKMLEHFYNSYAKRVFSRAAEDQANHNRLVEIFRPYNISLQFK